MDRYRLIASIVVLFIYLLTLYPWQTLTVAAILGIAYVVLRNLNSNNTEIQSKTMRRRSALNEAKIYLAPYTDIWRNLRLSNKYCTLRLGYDGQTITAKESSVYGNRSLRVVRSNVHSINDLWDMLCISFDHNTSFNSLLEFFRRSAVQIKIDGQEYTSSVRSSRYNETQEKEETISKEIKVDAIPSEKKEKLDVNNASEVELTALPGVSIVMAKKLINKREEIGGFKSVNDVCIFLKLKPHMQVQLEELICVKKMKGSINIKRFKERKLDL